MEIRNKQRGTFVTLMITACFICFQQRVESITLLVGRDEDSLKEVDQVGKQKRKPSVKNSSSTCMYNVLIVSVQ